jgi:urease gamma subunit
VSYVFGLTIEALVAALLLLTILYCARLNKQIARLKADEQAMKSCVVELVAATEKAERAIAGLKLTATEADDTLGARLREAEKFSKSFAENLEAGNELLNRLRKIAYANNLLSADNVAVVRPAKAQGTASSALDPKAVAAAAQAFADRAQARVHGRAA